MTNKIYSKDLIQSAMTFFCLVILIAISIDWGVVIYNHIKKTSQTYDMVTQMEQNYSDLAYENEILWSFVENLDTYKSLEDAVDWRDNHLPDLIQFVDE